MKNIFSKLKNFVQKHKIWSILIAIVIIIVLFVILGRKQNSPTDFVTVQKHDIVEEVSETGNVVPLSNLDLSFESSGEVAHVYVAVGDKVSAGEELSSLSNADLSAAVEQAKAGLQIAEANLSSLQNGSTPQQIAVNQSQVEKAESDISDAENSLVNSIQDSYNKSDDAVRNYTDVMFTNPRTQNPTLQFQADPQLNNDIVAERTDIETMLNSWSTSSESLTTDSDLNSAVETANDNLTYIQTFLKNLALAINNLTPVTISQSTLTIWKTAVSTARAEVDLAISNLSAASSQYQSAISSLDVANSQLTLIKTGATSDQLQASQAAVAQAQANVDAAQANFDKSIIISPISGVITNVNAKVGETMQSGIPAISVISYGQYDVESYVPEADISKVKIGDVATTTLDAYGSDTFFPTSVVKIDPGETIIEDVPTYKVTLNFASSSDNRIKSGMTANLDILTGQANGVLAVPSRSVYSIDINKYVKLIDPSNPLKSTQTQVETGMRGIDGYIQIISGLKEGDQIVASPNI